MSIDLADNVIALTDKWRANPFLYLDECLGVESIWKLQSDLLKVVPEAIETGKPIVIGSGHALGKDFICSCIAHWFLDCFIPSKVILTAPSDRQVKKIMWAEALSRFNNKKIKLWGKAFTNPYLEIKKENWFMYGFATKDTGASADAGGGKFQGLRATKNMCVIMTEAQAVEDTIYDQVDAVCTGENSLRIYIGNPTRAKGQFAKMLKDKKNNITFNFSCLDNPNYKQRKTVIPGLALYNWVENKRAKWGESDPRWVGRVLGQVPDNALSNTFPQSLIDHMRERCGFLSIHLKDAGVAVDSSGEGVDANVIMSGMGGEVVDVHEKTLMTPTEICHKAVEMCKAVNGHFVVFDCDGVGIRDYQEACKLSPSFLQGIKIIKFHGSGKSDVLVDGEPIYQNVRAEAAFVTKDRGSAGLASINEYDKELIDDLMEEEYFENKRGLIQIEPKEDIKERLERSPGRGDAYKMLQWAFDQEITNEVYKDTEVNRLPQYGRTDADMESNMASAIDLPRYGRTE